MKIIKLFVLLALTITGAIVNARKTITISEETVLSVKIFSVNNLYFIL